jgi:hypothetical protein
VTSVLLTVDVAHPPCPPGDVEELLLQAWGRVRNSATLRVMKIIHGYGSSGRGGTTRDVVRNWAFSRRTRFRMVINGEDYDVSDPPTQELRREVGAYDDPDLHGANPGITIVWVK